MKEADLTMRALLCVKSVSRKMRLLFVAAVLTALSAAFLCLRFLHPSSKNNTAVFTIDEKPVVKAEFILLMSDNRSDVFTYFFQKYHISDNSAFWTSRFGNEVPLQVLKQKAIVRLRQVRAVRDLAEMNGISTPASYPIFLKNLSAKNRSRKSPTEKGDAVYGPVSFSAIQYYQYLYDDEMKSTKSKMENGPLLVTDDQIGAYYQQNRDTAYHNQDGSYIPLADVRPQIIHTLQDQKYDAIIQEMVKKQTVVLEKEYDRISIEDCS